MDKQDYKNIWIHIERDSHGILPVSYELCSEGRKIADACGEKLVAISIGSPSDEETSKLVECGVEQVIVITGTGYYHYSTEAYTSLYTYLCTKYRPSALFVGATANGRDFAPRAAVRLKTGCTSDATELIYNRDTGDIEFVEPAAGGKIMAVITIPELRPQIGTLRPGTFKCVPCSVKTGIDFTFEEVNFDPSEIKTIPISYKPDTYDPEFDIAVTDRLICLGAGLKDESLDKYKELARLLNAKICCTRPLVDRELLSAKLQVGQSGVSVKTKLYIGFGVSGAINHMTGITADMIVAVNTDPDAPIFHYCDYGIVGDMDTVCDELIKQLRSRAES